MPHRWGAGGELRHGDIHSTLTGLAWRSGVRVHYFLPFAQIRRFQGQGLNKTKIFRAQVLASGKSREDAVAYQIFQCGTA
jgi:hypothetical protein